MEDDALLSIAEERLRIRSANDKNTNVGKWLYVKAGVFVTAYKSFNFSSSTVWCCYSNGEYAGVSSVLENLYGAIDACLKKDPRKTRQKPVAVEISVLAPRHKWQPRALRGNVKNMIHRSEHRSIYVKTLNGGSAIYLPAVWGERPQRAG